MQIFSLKKLPGHHLFFSVAGLGIGLVLALAIAWWKSAWFSLFYDSNPVFSPDLDQIRHYHSLAKQGGQLLFAQVFLSQVVPCMIFCAICAPIWMYANLRIRACKKTIWVLFYSASALAVLLLLKRLST